METNDHNQDNNRRSPTHPNKMNTSANYSVGTKYTQFEQSMMQDWERQNSAFTTEFDFNTRPAMPLPTEWDINSAYPFTWDMADMIGYTGGGHNSGSREAEACDIMTGFPISMPSSACFLGSEEPSGWKGAVDIIMVEEEEGYRAVEEDVGYEAGGGEGGLGGEGI